MARVCSSAPAAGRASRPMAPSRRRGYTLATRETMQSPRYGFVPFALLVCAACHQGTPAPQEPTASEPPPGEPAVDACATVRCMAGTHCVLQGEGAACEPDGAATGASC